MYQNSQSSLVYQEASLFSLPSPSFTFPQTYIRTHSVLFPLVFFLDPFISPTLRHGSFATQPGIVQTSRAIISLSAISQPTVLSPDCVSTRTSAVSPAFAGEIAESLSASSSVSNNGSVAHGTKPSPLSTLFASSPSYKRGALIEKTSARHEASSISTTAPYVISTATLPDNHIATTDTSVRELSSICNGRTGFSISTSRTLPPGSWHRTRAKTTVGEKDLSTSLALQQAREELVKERRKRPRMTVVGNAMELSTEVEEWELWLAGLTGKRL